jgi:hypothetical protein
VPALRFTGGPCRLSEKKGREQRLWFGRTWPRRRRGSAERTQQDEAAEGKEEDATSDLLLKHPDATLANIPEKHLKTYLKNT